MILSDRKSGDGDFLDRVDTWHGELARDLVRRNGHLTQEQLDLAVRHTIGRVVLLRMCEVRGAAPHGTLRAAAEALSVDARTESSQPPGEPLSALSIDKRLLVSIVAEVCDAAGPWAVSGFEIEMLGHVYERLLSGRIRLAGGRRIDVERKAASRKSGGVYYTPAQIVDYVVRHTVGRWLQGKTPQQAEVLRLVDPACGAGALLIGAYRYLLQWHRDWYVAHGPEAYAGGRWPRLSRGGSGEWHLRLDAKRQILARSVYGVDIDPQAVQVTRHSLALVMLEGEPATTAAEQMRSCHAEALRDVAAHVRCGNALVGPNFHGDRLLSAAEEVKREELRPMDWQAAFPEVFSDPASGFGVVLANPPWGQKAIDKNGDLRRYLRDRFPSTAGIYDTFRPFVEQGVRLTAPEGYFGMVLPDIVLLKDYAPTRRLLLESLALERIDWWGNAFRAAVIDAATIIGWKSAPRSDHRVAVHVRDDRGPLRHGIPQADFWENPRLTFNLHLTSQRRRLLRGLDGCSKLGEYFEVHEGVHSGNIRKELFLEEPVDGSCRELYLGRGEIAPYRLQWEGRFVRLAAAPERRSPERYANLGRCEWYESEKLLVRRTGDFVLAAVDRQRRYACNNFFLVLPNAEHPLDLDGLCALLNSRAITWYFRTIEPRIGRVFAELKIKHLVTFPLPDPRRQAEGCRRLNRLGRQRAELANTAAEACEEEAVHSEIERCDRAIEALVGQLLSLPPDLIEEVRP